MQADYVLAVKDNQPKLAESITIFFEIGLAEDLFRLDKTRKGGIHTRRFLAASSDSYRESLLGFASIRCDCPELTARWPRLAGTLSIR